MTRNFGDYKIEIRGEGVHLYYDPPQESGKPDNSHPVAYVGRIFFKEDLKGWKIILWPLLEWSNNHLINHIFKVIKKDMTKYMKYTTAFNRDKRKLEEQREAQKECEHKWIDIVAVSTRLKTFKCRDCDGMVSYDNKDMKK